MDSTKNHNTIDTITITGASGADYTFGATSTMWAPNANTVWATNTADWSIGSSISQPTSSLELNGDNADILVNGRSLMGAIDALEQRLNILVPNPELEAEWDELRELGNRYRELERLCKEKGSMWAKLKEIRK